MRLSLPSRQKHAKRELVFDAGSGWSVGWRKREGQSGKSQRAVGKRSRRVSLVSFGMKASVMCRNLKHDPSFATRNFGAIELILIAISSSDLAVAKAKSKSAEH
ncbi:hypothetical protein ACLOJK_005661 [Asimina triloba]